jgi:phosphoribosylaminoimidazolecarboxamide formyltransferase/IMP cyclohydrolase
MAKIQQALVSVSDKTGLTDFVGFLANDLKVNILSTGGTARALSAAGVKVTEVAEYTRSPELLDGRVKTLHPKVHAGILYRRDVAAHVGQMKTMGWEGIDMVVVNLYPFESVIRKEGTTFEEAVENIDIGGPSLLRASAKNHAHVAVVSDPADYEWVKEELKAKGGELSPESLRKLAQKAFARTSAYDKTISEYLLERLK